MATLGIFSVKKLRHHKGLYYTYGGFGEYLAAMRASFERVVLVAHVKDGEPPPGHYLVPPGGDLHVVHLPYCSTELGILLSMPIIILQSWKAVSTIDFAHCRMPGYTGLVGALVCRIRRRPLCCQIVADWRIEAKAVPVWKKGGLGLLLKMHLLLYDYLERLVCRNQLVFAQGESCYRKHESQSDCELDLSSAHHITDIVALGSNQRFENSPFTILTVGRLTSVKNHALTIRALAMLRQNEEPWRVVIVGEGPLDESLHVLADDLGVGRFVSFKGQVVHGPELWQHFDEADCFALSSRSEGTPKVLLEAMARELPIIAANVGGIPSLVSHEERGLLFRDNEVEELVKALRRVSVDCGLRQTMISNGRNFALEHTVERQTQRMLSKVFRRWPGLAANSS